MKAFLIFHLGDSITYYFSKSKIVAHARLPPILQPKPRQMTMVDAAFNPVEELENVRQEERKKRCWCSQNSFRGMKSKSPHTGRHRVRM
jgi:hypothetical protein